MNWIKRIKLYFAMKKHNKAIEQMYKRKKAHKCTRKCGEKKGNTLRY